MGRDLTLYPKAASKKELKTYIESLGFTKCDHLWDWPKGTLNYFWFDTDDHKSIDGVEADIHPVAEIDEHFNGNKWALHVRNTYWASWHDVHMLNSVLRNARKRFGGDIFGDFGKNRYAPLWKDESTPLSRATGMLLSQITSNLSKVKCALPEPMTKIKHRPETPYEKKIDDFMRQSDPMRVIYNGLVPFAISIFEAFFGNLFQLLLKYDKTAQQKILTHRKKIEFQTLLEVSNNQRSIENVIASSYTFQNIDQLNKAYKEWLNIDVRNILYKKRRIGKSFKIMEKRLSEIIQYRHGIVHHFQIDPTLSRDDYIEILELVERSIFEVTSFIEKKYSIKIGLELYTF